MSKKENKNEIVILMADDDQEDRMLAQEALQESKLSGTMHFVEDGEQLLDYLHRRGKFSDKQKYPDPGVILLDLNMPRKDGREVLKELKSSSRLRAIPVVVLTTSKAEEDVLKTYDLGVNSYITKPVSFELLVDTMKTLGKYWFQVVELPQKG